MNETEYEEKHPYWYNFLHRRVGSSYANLSPLELVQIRFWESVTRYAESRWLQANGWRRTREGWLLPDWHPHKRRAQRNTRLVGGKDIMGGEYFVDPDTGVGRRGPTKEPYDQQHAANSQRAHCNKSTVQWSNKAAQSTATPPSLARARPYLYVLVCLTNALLICGDVAKGHWTSKLFFLAAGLSFCVTCWFAWRTRRDIELDAAEQQLGKVR